VRFQKINWSRSIARDSTRNTFVYDDYLASSDPISTFQSAREPRREFGLGRRSDSREGRLIGIPLFVQFHIIRQNYRGSLSVSRNVRSSTRRPKFPARISTLSSISMNARQMDIRRKSTARKYPGQTRAVLFRTVLLRFQIAARHCYATQTRTRWWPANDPLFSLPLARRSESKARVVCVRKKKKKKDKGEKCGAHHRKSKSRRLPASFNPRRVPLRLPSTCLFANPAISAAPLFPPMT